MLNTTSVMKMTALAAAIAVSGGCVSAKMNPNDEAAAAAPAPAKEMAKPMAAPAEPTAVTSHTVVKGEHLWGISSLEPIYGTPFNWPLIYKANSDQIKDADLIYPGQVLAIPRDMGQSAIDAAVHHAKTRGSWAVGPVEATDTAYLGG